MVSIFQSWIIIWIRHDEILRRRALIYPPSIDTKHINVDGVKSVIVEDN
jgi:hypothetical protein